MNEATFRFYADLNDFLPSHQQRPFPQPVYDGTQSVKHLIEALGVPHTEVEVIVVNGRSVDFNYLVQAGDRVNVYPPFHTVDVSPLVALRPLLTPPYRFVLDNHLGKLARTLRLLGLDTLYVGDAVDDAAIAQLAHAEERILLTRDRGLLKRSNVVYGYCLRTRDSLGQLTAVVHRYQLRDQLAPWTRCLRCNGRLRPVAKEAILNRLEPKTKLYFDVFRLCETCGQIYWQGSHFARLQEIVDKMAAGERE
ncbi:MAG: Mut7-C ubiquitin/RNAse domain-containing protein [Anaerolineaceae bacterium]|nr:Mut7-C ubiquitin/RNAse domain-containing protein [Anaerolineaceae bacterium]